MTTTARSTSKSDVVSFWHTLCTPWYAAETYGTARGRRSQANDIVCGVHAAAVVGGGGERISYWYKTSRPFLRFLAADHFPRPRASAAAVVTSTTKFSAGEKAAAAAAATLNIFGINSAAVRTRWPRGFADGRGVSFNRFAAEKRRRDRRRDSRGFSAATREW